MAVAVADNNDLFGKLKIEYETATTNLKEIDESIKKITGRDPAESRQNARRMAQAANGEFRGREKGDRMQGQALTGNEFSIRGKRGVGPNRMGGARGRNARFLRPNKDESPDEDEPPRKVSVQSSVVATPREVKSRKDTIEIQKGDKKVVERNRRMFGMILGTLQKFQNEETKRKDQFQKRAEIEQKLEEAANKEKEEMRKERQGLFLTRREKQAQMRRIEQKLEIVQLHDEWEKNQLLLLNFIMTKCAPSVAYKPKKPCPESEKRFAESRERIQENIRQQKENIFAQLAEIDELYHKDGGEDEDETETVEPVKDDKENLGPTAEEAVAAADDDRTLTLKEEADPVVNPIITDEPSTVVEGEKESLTQVEDNGSSLLDNRVSNMETEKESIPTEPKELPMQTESEDKITPIVESGKPLDAPIGDQEFEPIYD